MAKYLKETLKTDQDLLKSMYWLGGKRGKGSGMIPGPDINFCHKITCGKTRCWARKFPVWCATVILANHRRFSSEFYENSTVRFGLKIRIDWYIYRYIKYNLCDIIFTDVAQ